MGTMMPRLAGCLTMLLFNGPNKLCAALVADFSRVVVQKCIA
jgi:hypothetical protein